MTQDSTEERRRKHMAVMDDGKASWQSEAMHQNALLHDALTRAEVAEAKLAKAVAALQDIFEKPRSADWPWTYAELISEMKKEARATLAEISSEAALNKGENK